MYLLSLFPIVALFVVRAHLTIPIIIDFLVILKNVKLDY